MVPQFQSFLISSRKTLFNLVLPYFLMPPMGGHFGGGREQNFPGKLNGNPNLVVTTDIYWLLTVGQAKGEYITCTWLILTTDEKAEAQERLSDLSKVTGLRVVDPGLSNTKP